MVANVDLSEEALEKILKERCSSLRRPGYTTVKDFFFPTTYERIADDVENFEVKDDDVSVCTFPKCGTTWTQEMVWCIGNDLNFDGAKASSLSARFPFLEFGGFFDYESIEDVKFREFLSNSVQHVKRQPSPRFIKTHLPFQLLPRQLRTGEKKPRILYVTRNPKDTCISYYHHAKLLESYVGNFEEFYRLFLGNKVTYGPYWDHVIEYWKRKDDDNMLIFSYEEMKADLNCIMRRVAKFLGKTNITVGQFKILENHLSFESMRNNDAVNLSVKINIFRELNYPSQGSHFIRSGQVNQWKENMSPEVVTEFDKVTKEKFGPLNIPIE